MRLADKVISLHPAPLGRFRRKFGYRFDVNLIFTKEGPRLWDTNKHNPFYLCFSN